MARQKGLKTRSLHVVNEHFECPFLTPPAPLQGLIRASLIIYYKTKVYRNSLIDGGVPAEHVQELCDVHLRASVIEKKLHRLPTDQGCQECS